jgi:IPT/TIG domain
MSVAIPKVNPGDLVKSQHWNAMIDLLDNLTLRVTALEGSTGASSVTIISVTSNTSPIRIGSRITVTGTGFAVPAQLNNVTIGSTTINPNAFTFASDGTHLIFDVPPVSGIAPGGTLATITVTNGNGSGSGQFMLHPLQAVPTGNIQVFYSSAPIMPALEPLITADRSYIFTYTIRTSVDLAATYAVVHSLTGQPWTAELLQDAIDLPRASPNIPIAGGMNVDTVVRIRVTVPAGTLAGASATLLLNVGAASLGTNILPGVSSPIAIAVGSPPPTPGTRARITLRSAVTAGRVQMARNTAQGVDFSLVAADPGVFSLSAAYRDPAGGTVNAIPSVNIVTASPGAPATANFTAVVHPGAVSMNTELIVTVQRGSPPNLRVEYWLPVTIN